MEGGLDGHGCGGVRILIVRAQPADEAALFVGGTLVIEGDEAGEEIVTRSVGVSPNTVHLA